MKTKVITGKQWKFLKWVLDASKIEEVYTAKQHFTFLSIPGLQEFFKRPSKNIIKSIYEGSNGEIYIQIYIKDFVEFIKEYQEYPPNSSVSSSLNVIKRDFEKEYLKKGLDNDE